MCLPFVPPQVCRSFCENVYSVCAEDIAGLKSFQPIAVFEPVVVPNCSALPAANDVSGSECWLPVTEPQFEELGCTYNCNVDQLPLRFTVLRGSYF